MSAATQNEIERLRAERDDAQQDLELLRRAYSRACEELSELKAALVEPGEPVPIGPAVSLVKELKEERDSLQRLANNRAEQRDALAAHVVAAQHLADEDRVDEALFTAHYEKPDPDTLGWKSRLGRDLHQVLKGASTTSLARLKAEWQADRAEQIREMCEGLTGSQIRSALDGLLAGLHRQAEGEDHA